MKLMAHIKQQLHERWAYWHENAPWLWEWMLLAAVLFALIAWKNSQQLPVVVFKWAQFCLAVIIAHRIDVRFFVIDKDEPRDAVRAAKEIARGIVFLGTVLSITLGI